MDLHTLHDFRLLRTRGSHTLVATLVMVATLAANPLASTLQAQLRGGGNRPVRSTGTSSYWFSGGASAAGLGTITDGPSGSRWDFTGDPRWLLRGTLEKSVGETTTIGIAGSYGTVDFGYRPLEGIGMIDPIPGDTSLANACRIEGCTGQTDVWGAQAVLRGGGGSEGLHQIVEVSAGAMSFRNLSVKANGESLGIENTIDVGGSIGYGFGYALSRDFHVAFVQDFGISWHRGDMLPEGTGRTYRTRNSRITLRYGL